MGRGAKDSSSGSAGAQPRCGGFLGEASKWTNHMPIILKLGRQQGPISPEASHVTESVLFCLVKDLVCPQIGAALRRAARSLLEIDQSHFIVTERTPPKSQGRGGWGLCRATARQQSLDYRPLRVALVGQYGTSTRENHLIR